MIKTLYAFLAITAVVLTGCTMTPKYTRPEAPIPAGWPSGPAYKETPSTQRAPEAADLQWREFFADERLQSIIATALKNNRDLRVAALNVERARALYRIQRAELLPGSGNRLNGQQATCQDFRDHRFGDPGGVRRQSGHQFLGG